MICIQITYSSIFFIIIKHYSTLGQLFCEVKFAPFSCPQVRRPHAPDSEEKALSNALRKALEPAVCRHLFPNYQV